MDRYKIEDKGSIKVEAVGSSTNCTHLVVGNWSLCMVIWYGQEDQTNKAGWKLGSKQEAIARVILCLQTCGS